MRVCLLSNSQGTSAGVESGQSYPMLLRTLLGRSHEIHWLVMSGWTIADMRVHLRDNVIALSPNIVVLNFGIVEAAQRILSTTAKRVLGALPLGHMVTRSLHSRRATVLKLRRHAGLSSRLMAPAAFAEHVAWIANELEAAGICSLFLAIPEIPDGGASLDHPFVNDDIRLFNALLPAGKSLSLPREISNESLMQPGTVHFSLSGHRMVADFLAAEIRKRTEAVECAR